MQEQLIELLCFFYSLGIKNFVYPDALQENGREVKMINIL